MPKYFHKRTKFKDSFFLISKLQYSRQCETDIRINIQMNRKELRIHMPTVN